MPLHSQRLEAGPVSSFYHFGPGLLGRLERFVEHHSRLVVISDRNVADLYRAKVSVAAEWLVVEPGEASKSLEQAGELYRQLAQLKVDRSAGLLAVGGGVVGDLGGFVAATYLRGLPFYQVPTSLLAMVDSSIGGKVGVDLPEGKNLVGAFYAPRSILVDPHCLDTLPEEEVSAGMAEVIKHALLDGEEHLASIEALDPASPGWEFVYPSAQVKMGVVARDPKEAGERAHLNLGHTLAHALESVSDYGLSHGRAVSLGLIAAVRLARRLGRLELDYEQRLMQLLDKWRLPTRLERDYGWPQVLDVMARDKKNRDGQLTFVVPHRPGQVEVVRGVDPGEVEEVYRGLCP